MAAIVSPVTTVAPIEPDIPASSADDDAAVTFTKFPSDSAFTTKSFCLSVLLFVIETFLPTLAVVSESEKLKPTPAPYAEPSLAVMPASPDLTLKGLISVPIVQISLLL